MPYTPIDIPPPPSPADTPPPPDTLRDAISKILDECVDMCADFVTCHDSDKHITVADGRWEGQGPNNYYRDRLLALFTTHQAQAVAEAEKRYQKLAQYYIDKVGYEHYKAIDDAIRAEQSPHQQTNPNDTEE